MLLACLPTLAQTVDEAALFSQTVPNGTARYTALGGAFTALGADPASLYTNPAGLGLYRTSFISFTPRVFVNNARADYFGNERVTADSRFQLPNFTYIKAMRRRENSDWRAINFGVGYNNTHTFSRQYRLEGQNASSSIFDFFNQFANQNGTNALAFEDFNTTPIGEETTFLAWNTFLLDTLPGGTSYVPIVSGRGNVQREVGEISGSKSEFTLGLSGNYRDRLYLGFNIGIPFLDYRRQARYSERDESGNFDSFDGLNYFSDFEVQGVGIRAGLGAVFRATEWLRIGGSIQSPERLSLNTFGSEVLRSDLVDSSGAFDLEQSVEYTNFSYVLRTAPKFSAGLALISRKIGLLSFDVDYVGYNSMRYSEGNNDLFDEGDNSAFFEMRNNEIQDNLQAAINLKVGGELVFDQFRVMAGAGMYGSPYQDQSAFGNTLSLSGGLGYQGKRVSVDGSLVRFWNTQQYRPYSVTGLAQPFAELRNATTMVTLSVGWRLRN